MTRMTGDTAALGEWMIGGAYNDDSSLETKFDFVFNSLLVRKISEVSLLGVPERHVHVSIPYAHPLLNYFPEISLMNCTTLLISQYYLHNNHEMVMYR